MVEPKSKRAFYFAAFILPCLVLYLIFFIVPFFNGINISLTNWDGLTPKSPISLNQSEFENNILSKLKESDKQYLLSVYELDSSSQQYKRLSLSGSKRRKVERVIKKSGWAPENNKFVGFDNYKKILTGKVSDDFYPHHYLQKKYSATSDLPSFISKKEFEKEVIVKATDENKRIISSSYIYNSEKEKYELDKNLDSFYIEGLVWSLPEVVETKTISDSKIDPFFKKIVDSSLVQDSVAKEDAFDDFVSSNEVSNESKQVIKSATDRIYNLGVLKNALAKTWVLKKFNMGVIGFTLFFAFFSVIGINLVAFGLALALDSGLKGQKVYRTLFFLPNVLSMVIVALIWSMLFVQLLPAITGIDKWISDPAKTPWLLVLVAIWQGAGYYMIVYLAGLQNIPTDVLEAATIDGASGWQKFKYVKLPLLLPAITISLFLTIANALKSFDLIYAMIGSTGYATGTVPFVMDIYFDAFAQKQAGLATAKAMLLFLVILAVTGLQLFLMKRKEVEQ